MINRIFETLQYHKAQTKRWAGSGGVQIQNLPRSEYKDGDLLPDDPDFTHGLLTDLQQVRTPLREVKNNIRRIFIAPEGLSFYCGDFSSIEPESIFWICDQGNVPARWYEKTAASIYKVDHNSTEKDSQERFVGKYVALSSLYGQGHKRLREGLAKEGIKMSVAEAKNAVHSFRNTHSFIPKLWKALETAFYQCIAFNKEITWTNRGISFHYERDNNRVVLTLPSGGRIFYNRPEATADSMGNIRLRYWDMSSTMVDKMADIWGGVLTEHLVSATAREVLASAILRFESTRFRIVAGVHDELWCYAPKGGLDQFKAVMEKTPAWCKGLRTKVDAQEGLRYLK